MHSKLLKTWPNAFRKPTVARTIKKATLSLREIRMSIERARNALKSATDLLDDLDRRLHS